MKFSPGSAITTRSFSLNRFYSPVVYCLGCAGKGEAGTLDEPEEGGRGGINLLGFEV